MKKVMEIKQATLVIASFTALIASVVFFGVGLFNRLDNIEGKIERTKQQTLKGNIYNEGMPLIERKIACRRYLELGFNSQTEQFCKELERRHQ